MRGLGPPPSPPPPILVYCKAALLVVVREAILSEQRHQVMAQQVVGAPVDTVEMVVMEEMTQRHQVTLVQAVVLLVGVMQAELMKTTFLVVEEVLVFMEKVLLV